MSENERMSGPTLKVVGACANDDVRVAAHAPPLTVGLRLLLRRDALRLGLGGPALKLERSGLALDDVQVVGGQRCLAPLPRAHRGPVQVRRLGPLAATLGLFRPRAMTVAQNRRVRRIQLVRKPVP